MFTYIFYYLFAFLIFLVIYFDVFNPKHKYYIFTFRCVYLLMALLVAFRYGVGNDTPGYMNFYKLVPTIDKLNSSFFEITRSQPLFIVMCSLCKTISNDFVLVQICQSFLFFNSLYILLKKLKLRYFFFLFIFFGGVYILEMVALRESLGLSFCFYALNYYLDNKYFRYYVLVTIGILFHTGVIVFYILPLMKLLKELSTKNFLILCVVAGLIFLAVNSVKDILQVVQVTAELGNAELSEENNLGLSTIILYSYEIIIVYYFSVLKGENKKVDFIYFGILSILLSFGGTAVLDIIYRYSSHFMIFYFFLLKDTLKKMKPNVISLIFVTFIVYSPIMKFTTITEEHPVLKYYSVFDSDKSEIDRIIRNTGTPLLLDYKN